MLLFLASFSCLILAVVSVYFSLKARAAYANGFAAGQQDAHQAAYKEGLHVGKAEQLKEVADFLKSASLEEILKEFGLADEVKAYANRIALAKLSAVIEPFQKQAVAKLDGQSRQLPLMAVSQATAEPEELPMPAYTDADYAG